ncbi:hypothetical protein [Caudoviricetes sp.]|nr:hypothetical protein [Caudoviricetes sp.]
MRRLKINWYIFSLCAAWAAILTQVAWTYNKERGTPSICQIAENIPTRVGMQITKFPCQIYTVDMKGVPTPITQLPEKKADTKP